MGHRAALYTVRVRKKFARKDQDARLLGDFDEAGTRLIDALDAVTNDFVVHTENSEKAIRRTHSEIAGNDLRLMFEHGQTGVVADIRGTGNRFFHQVADDEQSVHCACLFCLPPNRDVGALVVHINNGRGIMGLLAKGLGERFRQRYSEVTLDMTPVVSVAALQEAVDRQKVERVTLVRYETPQDRVVADTTKWVRANDIGKLELNITAHRAGQTLITNLLRSFRRNFDPRVFAEIVEFGGIKFEQAKVEVQLPNGDRRTFNIEKPEAGHPITHDLNRMDLDAEGEPVPASLFRALRVVAREVVG